MNLGEATAIFRNIDLSERTAEEKKSAIRTVLGMETHNGITKQEIINALDWLMNHPTAYDVDKVVEQLKEKSDDYENAVSSDRGFKRYCNGISAGYRFSIDIVKAGGTNG